MKCELKNNVQNGNKAREFNTSTASKPINTYELLKLELLTNHMYYQKLGIDYALNPKYSDEDFPYSIFKNLWEEIIK